MTIFRVFLEKLSFRSEVSKRTALKGTFLMSMGAFPFSYSTEKIKKMVIVVIFQNSPKRSAINYIGLRHLAAP